MDLRPKESDLQNSNQMRPLYQMNLANFMSIGAYLDETFSIGWFNDATIPSTRKQFYSDEPLSAPDMGRELAESSNLSATITNVAARMSEAIRINPNSTQTGGVVFVTQAYIRVRWPWTALPVGLLSAIFGVLIATIIVTRETAVPAWKASVLAMLFHQVKEREETSTPLRPNNVEKIAGATRAVLGRDDSMTFVKSEKLP